MYSKAEASKIKKEFWTSFGSYMKPIPNADGEKINWVNYKTGINHIYFRLDAYKNHASASIEITHPLTDARHTVYNNFIVNRNFFEQSMREAWHWQQDFYDEHGRAISRIYTTLHGVNVLNKADWPAIISFLKDRIIQLDEFWSVIKLQFV